MIVELVILVISVLLLLTFVSKKPYRFPPGPPLLPIGGNVFHLMRWGSSPHLCMVEAARRYGDVVGLFMGRLPVIIISGFDAIKEASSRDDMTGRPYTPMQKFDQGSYGIVMTSGEKWREQRRFVLRHLRDFGFGKSSLEVVALEELQAVFEEIEKFSGGQKTGWANPVPVCDILGAAGINVLWHVISGKRYSHDDQYLKKLINNVTTLLSMSQPTGGLGAAFPFLAKIFPSLSKRAKFMEIRNTLLEFIQEEVQYHRENFDSQNPRDFIDIYLAEVEKVKDNEPSAFEEKQLVHICLDLFMAGTDTTFNSLTFCLLYMILYPEIQRKVQEELDDIVGRDRFPSLDHRSKLPYTEATLHEVMRLSSVAPLSVPHAPHSNEDIEFRGFIIPKKCIILHNLYALHHDPKIWSDPKNFRPERFIDENGKFCRHEALLPFGTGKRSCLGESLARNNLFLFFAGLMHRYTMKVPEDGAVIPQEPKGGLTLGPKPFKVHVKYRT